MRTFKLPPFDGDAFPEDHFEAMIVVFFLNGEYLPQVLTVSRRLPLQLSQEILLRLLTYFRYLALFL